MYQWRTFQLLKRKLIIRGSGGGGGGGGGSPRAPVESADSLRSKSTAKIVDLNSEGEIEGLIGGAKGIYLDETPIQNEDGSYNFKGVEFQTRNGTQDQTYIPGFNTVENEFFVSVKVVKDSPIVRSVVNTAVDAVKVRIAIPQMLTSNPTTGDITGSTVRYTIELRPDGGSYSTVVDQTVTGKTTSKYQKSHLIELTGNAPWDIRITRVTDDDKNVNVQSSIYFEAITHIVNAKLRYPNSAITALKIDSSQFGNVPQRAYKMRGIKVKIPDNATVDPITGSLSYSGSWGGDFVVAWTTNPAWILYDLLTSERYGLGSYLTETQIDKWGLYTIGRYCDEKVSDGNGGLEPRFSCGCLYIQDQSEAYTIIQNISSIFRGMSYWASGAFTVTQDSPSDPVVQFSQANVLEGKFIYQGSGSKARHSVALVTYNDPQDFFKQKVEYVEDSEAIRTLGYVPTQVYAVGCTSRGQAHRLGKWIIYTERYETETITFRLGIEGSLVRPGQVFSVLDKLRAGKRRSGRIFTATISQVIIDYPLEGDLTGGEIACMLPNGQLETRTITAISDKTISVTPDFSTAPQAHSIWGVSSTDLEPQLFRAISVIEADRGVYEVTGLAYNESKFNAVENDLALEQRTITTLTARPSAPENLQANESLYSVGGSIKNKVVLSWDRVNDAVEYHVNYRRENGNFVALPTLYSNEVEILDVSEEKYFFQVVALSALGIKSPAATLEKQLYGKTAAPKDVENFSLFPNGNVAFLTWKQSTDLDVIQGGFVRLRHTPRLTGALWGSSVDIIDFVPGSDTFATAPLLEGTYLAKFVDSSGNESETEAIAITTVPFPSGLNVVESVVETASFAGLHRSTEYNPDLGLTLTTSVLWDDLPLIDDILRLIDWPSDVIAFGRYFFENTVDLGQPFTSNLTALIKTLSFDVGLLIDDILEPIDDWTDFDGANVAATNAKLYVRTTVKDPNPSVTRATTGTYFDKDFIVRTAAIDVARQSYDPADPFVDPAILIEDAIDNKLLRSEDFTHADWQFAGTTNYTRTANATTAPDSNTTADSVVVVNTLSSFDATSPNQEVTKATSVKPYTFSVFVKNLGSGGAHIRMIFDSGAANYHSAKFDLVNGDILEITSGGTVADATATILSLPNNWYRITVSGNSDTSALVRCQIFATDVLGASFTGDGTKGLYLWGAQLEESLTASSYIPTTSAVVTRAQDVLISDPEWTAWKPFFTGSYLARAYQFRIDLSTTVSSQNIAVQELEVTIDMPDRTESHEGWVSGLANPFHIDFDYEFNAVPAIGIITHNLASGDYYVVSNKTTTGFDIVFKNASNTVVSRTFDTVVKGYGLKG